MNTPEPCDKCKYLYYNVLFMNNPADASQECKLEHELGNPLCKHFCHWMIKNNPKPLKRNSYEQ